MHGLLNVMEYAVALRAPLIAVGFLVLFPVLAFTKGRSLFRGLFDQTPLSLLAVTLSAFSLASTAMRTGRLVLRHGTDRVGLPPISPGRLSWLIGDNQLGRRLVWMSAMLVLSLCVVVPAIYLSQKQGRPLWRLVVSSLAGLVLGAGVT